MLSANFRQPSFEQGVTPSNETETQIASRDCLLTFLENNRKKSTLSISIGDVDNESISSTDHEDSAKSSSALASAPAKRLRADSESDEDTNGEEMISVLDAHLIAFRNSVDECDTPIIPPQLLRVIRFFPFKWNPLKRALLRPPSMNEVGKNTRLSLVKLLHEKKLIATAEMDLFEQNFYADSDKDNADVDRESHLDGPEYSSSQSFHRRKRHRANNEMRDELRMVFSRFPMDKGNHCSVRHMKSVLNGYNNAEASDNSLPTPDEVAEWALLSFCGLVVANGMDEPNSIESEEYLMESQMVILLTQETVQNQKFTKAVKRRIQNMLEPPLLERLSNLNILCLSRLFSYLDKYLVAMLFRHSLDRMVDLGDGSGFSSIPKLLACYASIASKRDKTFSFSSLQANVKELLQPKDSDGGEVTRSKVELAGNLFDLSKYLLRESSTRSKTTVE